MASSKAAFHWDDPLLLDQQLSGDPDASATLHSTGLASLPLPPTVASDVMGYTGR